MSGASARCDRFRPGLQTEDPGAGRGAPPAAPGGAGPGPGRRRAGSAARTKFQRIRFKEFDFSRIRFSRIRSLEEFEIGAFSRIQISRTRFQGFEFPKFEVLENSNPWNSVSKDLNSRAPPPDASGGKVPAVLPRRRRTKAPLMASPCIPTRGTKVSDRDNWFHEVKHDGYRLTRSAVDAQRLRLDQSLSSDRRGCAHTR